MRYIAEKEKKSDDGKLKLKNKIAFLHLILKSETPLHLILKSVTFSIKRSSFGMILSSVIGKKWVI